MSRSNKFAAYNRRYNRVARSAEKKTSRHHDSYFLSYRIKCIYYKRANCDHILFYEERNSTCSDCFKKHHDKHIFCFKCMKGETLSSYMKSSCYRLQHYRDVRLKPIELHNIIRQKTISTPISCHLSSPSSISSNSSSYDPASPSVYSEPIPCTSSKTIPAPSKTIRPLVPDTADLDKSPKGNHPKIRIAPITSTSSTSVCKPLQYSVIDPIQTVSLPSLNLVDSVLAPSHNLLDNVLAPSDEPVNTVLAPSREPVNTVLTSSNDLLGTVNSLRHDQNLSAPICDQTDLLGLAGQYSNILPPSSTNVTSVHSELFKSLDQIRLLLRSNPILHDKGIKFTCTFEKNETVSETFLYKQSFDL